MNYDFIETEYKYSCDHIPPQMLRDTVENIMEIVLYDISRDQIHYKRFLEIEAKHNFENISNQHKKLLNDLLVSLDIDPNNYVNFSQFRNFSSLRKA
jgi:hypothetical protein